MDLKIHGFEPGGPIPGTFALGVPGTDGPVTWGGNRNPALSWSGLPEGTRSLAMIVVDPDAPASGELVNIEGKRIPKDFPRGDFHHWVLVDIPPDLPIIAEGIDSQRVQEGGKAVGGTDYGVRGRNDYTDWFAGDPQMEGVYGGWDGPCPPWNDERVHSYRFVVYAIDVDTLGLSDRFTGGDARQAMAGHILDRAEIVGLYAINPDARQS